MATVHILTAQIALAGDITNVAHRTPSDPVTYPELMVLEEIHGEGSIRECAVIGEKETTAAAEKSRLLQRYGAIVEHVYPGRSPQMELTDPTYKPAKVGKGKGKSEDKTDDKSGEPEDDADPFANAS